MNKPIVSSLLLILLFVSVLSGCGHKNASSLPEPNATVDLTTGATIKGTIKLAGLCPQAPPISSSGNMGCHQGMVTEQHWVVNNGSVANAIIYIKDGLGDNIYAAPATPVILDQRGCIYYPHVMGLMLGQTLKVLNSDSTLHNVHLVSMTAGESFNCSFPPGMKPFEQKFATTGMKTITCDVHGWMNSYVGVFTHPFFAVTDTNGNYEIRGVPPGNYTLELWHESGRGSQNAIVEDQKISVAAKDMKTADFVITAR
jgi:plastocyanin